MKKIAVSVAVVLCVSAGLADQSKAKPPEPDRKIVDLKLTAADYALGSKDAKIVLVEYASLTCPHCAEFHSQVISKIKKEFVHTGKVRYIYRDFPLDRLALGAAMIARCAERDSFFGFIDTFYATQARWSGAPNPIVALGKLARLGGMSQSAIEQCTKNVAVQNEILSKRLEAANLFKVRSTPTIFVNGKQYSGDISLSKLQNLLQNLLSQ
ncbi:MAG: DsbA family protein [Pseudomonadota bacterium]|nr:DsbA family protein [Pseudomonadota bacterium]